MNSLPHIVFCLIIKKLVHVNDADVHFRDTVPGMACLELYRYSDFPKFQDTVQIFQVVNWMSNLNY